MTFPYELRLLVLCLAVFFVVHFALSVVAWLMSATAVALAQRMRPRDAARLLLSLRFLPAVCALLAVAGLCAPSYLWLEPRGTSEPVGVACLAAAILGAGVWAASLGRAGRALLRSYRHTRECRRIAHQTRVAGHGLWLLDGAAPVVMLSGILRPRLVISRSVVSALSTEQLSAVLRHEDGHRVSHDNLKRLLVLLAPGLLPFVRGFGALERGWMKMTEWNADDHAAGGDQHRSVTLAAALVRVARLGAVPPALALSNSFMANAHDLAARVDRLLSPVVPEKRAGSDWITTAAGSLVTAALFAILLRPSTLYLAHSVLERLIR